MKIRWNSKYNTISIYAILTFTACLAVYAIIFNFTVIGEYISKFLTVIAPIIWGLVIAYLVNPIMKWIEKQVKKLTGKKGKKHPKLNRAISLICSMTIFIACIAALLAIILPQVIDSIMGIVNNLGTYVKNIQDWIDSLMKRYPKVLEQFNAQLENIEKALTEAVNNLVPKVGDLMKKITDGTVSLLVALKNFLIGLIVAIYFLADKEHFQAQLKKATCAFFPKKGAETFMRICSQTNESISGFVSGKLIDSLIIGCLCFISMTVMQLDFVVLISVIIGVTNIIPFFGPFIGTIPSAFLLLISSPKQVIPFLILVLVLQQLDGNVIGPKILGQSVGLSAFWVLFSILVGGGMFGFGGMILGVPIFAVIYSLITEYLAYLLENRNLSTLTDDYRPIPEDEIPPEPPKVMEKVSLEKIKKKKEEKE